MFDFVIRDPDAAVDGAETIEEPKPWEVVLNRGTTELPICCEIYTLADAFRMTNPTAIRTLMKAGLRGEAIVFKGPKDIVEEKVSYAQGVVSGYKGMCNNQRLDALSFTARKADIK